MVWNVNEKIGKQRADLGVRQAARVGTKSGKGVEVFEPIGHVECHVIRNGIGKLRLAKSNFANPCLNSEWIDRTHDA